MQRLLGLLAVLVCVVGGFVAAGGNPAILWQPSEFIIIIGAAAGSMAIGNSKAVLHETWIQVKTVMMPTKDDNESLVYQELFTLMHLLLDDIRTKGMKSLDEHIEEPQNSTLFMMYPSVSEKKILLDFIVDNIRCLGMGKMTPHELDTMLEGEIYAIEEEMLKPSHALHKTGEACPGFGILAAVLGIVITMQGLDGPLTAIGAHVAAALIGTFIGIFLCYCLLEPLASAMADAVAKNVELLNCIKIIFVAQVRGKAPLLAIDAGRRILDPASKPSFTQMENWIINRSM